jgi:exodeoxyribonuclease VII large subunit
MEWIRLNENRIYTVSDVNMYIKQVLDSDRALFDIYIKGEISNYKTYPSGHHYFTLKDEGGVLKSVMFRSDAQRLVFRPENGMKVITPFCRMSSVDTVCCIWFRLFLSL